MAKTNLEVIMLMNGPSGDRRLALDEHGVLFTDAPRRRQVYHCSEGEAHLRYWRSHRAPWRFYCEHEVTESVDPRLEKIDTL